MQAFPFYFPQIQYLKKHKQSYLDSAATTLKPQCVIDSLNELYKTQVANVHRGDHYLSESLTTKYEEARSDIQKWIHAQSAEEIIFTKSTTESINLISFSLEDIFQENDIILLTEMDHHSNILPWQALAKRKNLHIEYIPISPSGELLFSEYKSQYKKDKKIKLIAFTYYSNVLGTRTPVEDITSWAKENNILTVVDAAQAVTAEPINVQNINCDFLAFSGHKLFAPSGVGVLYAKKSHFKYMKPWQMGGGMITNVELSNYEAAEPPFCFEAGTPFIEGVLALKSVLHFLKEQGFFEAISKTDLLQYAEEELKKIPDLSIISSPVAIKKNILSFTLKSVHCRDLGQLISQAGVAVRSGHHCCLPLMKKLNLPSGTVRASFSIYNDEQDVVSLIKAIKKAKSICL